MWQDFLLNMIRGNICKICEITHVWTDQRNFSSRILGSSSLVNQSKHILGHCRKSIYLRLSCYAISCVSSFLHYEIVYSAALLHFGSTDPLASQKFGNVPRGGLKSGHFCISKGFKFDPPISTPFQHCNIFFFERNLLHNIPNLSFARFTTTPFFTFFIHIIDNAMYIENFTVCLELIWIYMCKYV